MPSLYKQFAKQLSAERCAWEPFPSRLLTKHTSADVTVLFVVL